jgi:hypothetical protein
VNGLPLLWRFDEEEEVLLHLSELPAAALHHAASFYRKGDKDNQFHNRGMPQDGQGKTVTTCCCLLPIPVGWATMFLDFPSMGTAFRRLVKLMQTARKVERTLLWPFCEGMALACG